MPAHPKYPPWWYRSLMTTFEFWAAGWGQRGEPEAIAARHGNSGPSAELWAHAASVGEVSGAVPVLQEICDRRPSERLYLSSMTPGGRHALGRHFPPERIGAPPFDSVGAVSRSLQRVSPQRLLIFETEIWPQWLASAEAQNVRVAFANARISDRSWGRYRHLAGWFRPLLATITAVAAQTEVDAERWIELGAPREAVRETGNTKLDAGETGAPVDGEGRIAARRELGIDQDGLWWTWGSLRPGEERWLYEVAKQLEDTPVQFLVVPRHPEQWGDREMDRAPDRVVWLRRLGVLPLAYRAADLSLVGGTLENFGGHNPAEPALLGLPVLLGESLQNCRSAAERLIQGGGAIAVRDPGSLAAAARHWIEDSAARHTVGENARIAMLSLRGASKRTVDWLQERGFWS